MPHRVTFVCEANVCRSPLMAFTFAQALKDAKDPELAREWVDLVTSEEGQKVLEKWNFEPAAK